MLPIFMKRGQYTSCSLKWLSKRCVKVPMFPADSDIKDEFQDSFNPCCQPVGVWRGVGSSINKIDICSTDFPIFQLGSICMKCYIQHQKLYSPRASSTLHQRHGIASSRIVSKFSILTEPASEFILHFTALRHKSCSSARHKCEQGL